MVWFTKGAFRKERLGKKIYFLEDTISLFLEFRFLIKNIMKWLPSITFSFPIAIKVPLRTGQHGLTELLTEEAKTMLKIDSYHEHIVNLQGITYFWDCNKQQISEVSAQR